MNVKNDAKKLITQIINPPKQVRRPQALRVMKVDPRDITLVSCTNVVMKVNTPDAVGFFTECRAHLPLAQYVRKLVDDYFDLIAADEFNQHDKQVVLSAIGKDGRLDEAAIGSDKAQNQRIRTFAARYLRPHLAQHARHKFLRHGGYHTRPLTKVLATEAIADLVGASDMIPHAEYVKLEINGLSDRPLMGIFMENAKGICAMDMAPEIRRQKLTGKIQRAFIRLNLLDVICYDMDHSPNNYNVYLGEDDMLEGIHAFDNNDSSTFALRKNINFSTYKNCAHIASADGTIARPAVDHDMAKRILGLRKGAFYRSTFPYIGFLQVECAWQRIRKLQKAIVLTRKVHPEIFLEADMFNDDTLNQELSGADQKTYLVSFLEDCKYRY